MLGEAMMILYEKSGIYDDLFSFLRIRKSRTVHLDI